ncbi:unnamed protein product, partial [Effrenium voratum]
DNDMRLASSVANSSVSSSSIPKMISSTIRSVQSLPEHKDRFKKLQVHLEICERCHEALADKRLTDLVALEQDLATRVVNLKAVDKELLQFLQDPALDLSLKLRLMLLCE